MPNKDKHWGPDLKQLLTKIAMPEVIFKTKYKGNFFCHTWKKNLCLVKVKNSNSEMV